MRMIQVLRGVSHVPIRNGSSMIGMRRVLLQGRGGSKSSSIHSSSISKSDHHVRVYEEKRSDYKKAVSLLRKEYALEVEREKQSQELEAEEEELKRQRQRLERQRTKYVKAAASAQRERAKREEQALKFEAHLERQQVVRENSDRLKKKAQSLLIAELEQEAPHWMTTTDEVERIFHKDNSEVQQQLWTQAGGCVGAPRPTQDAEFWKYVSHTWDMSRTYLSPRDLLLEEIQDQLYDETNIDFDDYWTSDRLQQQQEIRQKAKLRAIIRHEGRKSLLLRQRQILQQQQQQQQQQNTNDQVGDKLPKPMPVPKLQVLANKEAMEQEGAKILQSNISKFINPKTGELNHTPGHTFPTFIGRLPRKDTRTEKEKKRDAREQKLLAAAAAKDAVEFAAEDSLQDGRKPLNYNELGRLKDEEDVEWEQEIMKTIMDNNNDDQNTKQLLSSIPSHKRYTQEDIDWIISQLEDKMSTLKEIHKLESLNDTSTTDVDTDTDDMVALSDQENQKDIDWDEWEKEFELERIYEQHESALSSLTPQQVDALNNIPTSTQTTSEELKKNLEKVPGLTPDQIQTLIDLEISLTQNQELLQLDLMDDKNNNNPSTDPSK